MCLSVIFFFFLFAQKGIIEKRSRKSLSSLLFSRFHVPSESTCWSEGWPSPIIEFLGQSRDVASANSFSAACGRHRHDSVDSTSPVSYSLSNHVHACAFVPSKALVCCKFSRIINSNGCLQSGRAGIFFFCPLACRNF